MTMDIITAIGASLASSGTVIPTLELVISANAACFLAIVPFIGSQLQFAGRRSYVAGFHKDFSKPFFTEEMAGCLVSTQHTPTPANL